MTILAVSIVLSLTVATSAVTAGGVARAATPPTPIEVEVQASALRCGPGLPAFDAGVRSALRSPRLDVTDATHATRSIENRFCLASERPAVKPIRIRVRIRSDATGANGTAEHWLIQVAVPFHAIRLAPARRQRTSLWTRGTYCEAIGSAVALCTLEALHRETGQIRQDESFALGFAVTRDSVYSVGPGAWVEALHELPNTVPLVVVWVLMLATVFVVVRFARVERRHSL